MTKHRQFLYVCSYLWLLALIPNGLALERWSRQLEETDAGVSDSFDWIPLAQSGDSSTQPKDRSGNGRVLTYSQAFPSTGHFSDFTKGFGAAPVSQKSSPFDFPYQFQNFGNVPQAQSLKQSAAGIKTHAFQGQDPTSQSFFKFEMPLSQQSSRLNSAQSSGGSGVNTGYQISHAFGGGAQATLFNSPLFNQEPVFPPEFHPVPPKPQTQTLQQKPVLQTNFLSNEPISLKNFFKENKPTPASSLQAVSPQVFPQIDAQNNPEFPLRAPFNTITGGATPSAPLPQQDQQFLFIPYNDIFNQAPQAHPSVQHQPPQSKLQQQVQTQPQYQKVTPQTRLQNTFPTTSKYNNNLPTVNPYQINQFYTPDSLGHQAQYFLSSTSSTTIRPQTTSLKPANVFQNFVNPQFNTTPKPKPKAHQPPLAMFLLRSSKRPTESDVVDILSGSKTVSVIDAPTQNPPEIFIGPSGMPIPNGYTKFDLPYLSQLQGSRDINDISFFVAPLSYRTRGGFNKILLPEPHVGSIVVNLSKSGVSQTVPQFYQPQQVLQQITTTTHRPRTSTQRIKSLHQSINSNRGNKFSYFYDQDPIQEVPSPQVVHKERPRKKKPQSVKIEQPSFSQQLNNPYAQFNPIPNQISTDEFYKLQTKPLTTSSTSTTSTTSTTTSTTTAPQQYYAYNTLPQVEYPGGSGHIYPEINQIYQQQPVQQEEKQRFTTRPTVAETTAEEEYRMKQYYRKQEANRHRPQVVAQTNPSYEHVQYTPVNLEYEIAKTTTKKPRITFYTPTDSPVQDDEYNTVPPRQEEPQLEQNQQSQQENNQLPVNHRPSYIQNEITDTQVEYEPNPYQLPSELPQLTPNFPGLVNNLKEMKDQQQINQDPTTSTQEQTTIIPLSNEEAESSTRPTRKPINRTRKPIATKVTSSVSYSESETFTRRPITRVRRPFGSRNTASTASSTNVDYDETTSSTTRRPSSARNPLIRNPNRIRYKPTPEERQTLRLKPKRKYNGSGKVVTETEDLDYQRDVLKQNYPVFKPSSSRRPGSSPTAVPASYELASTEAATAETQQIYTVTPSNNVDNEQGFPSGLLEPMQIAQQYNEYKNNYGPGYFPNQEDVNPTEPVLRNEINPVYSTIPTTTPSTTTIITTTTTTEAPISITTRRSPFIRRNYPRLRATTTETPSTTTPAEEEKPSTRNRLPPRKIIKVRARTRRPLHPASPTPAQEDENESTEQPKHNYRKLNRFNQDLYENDTPKRRYKQKFQLEGQESQWSPAAKVVPANNFKPTNPKENRSQQRFENEPEIVTAGPKSGKERENYEIKVSANYGPSAPNKMTPNLKPEKSFAELLEEVMGKTPEEKVAETTTNPEPSTDGTVFDTQKTTIANRILRRGKWKKTRVSSSVSTSNGNGESFEAAESQNLGSQIYNSLHKTDKSSTSVDTGKDFKTTTPMTTAAEINSMYNSVATTPAPLNSMEEYGMSTVRSQESLATTLPMDMDEEKPATVRPQSIRNEEESATRRMDEDMDMEDDLEIQPSLFSEVKKQLHELFSIEESDDTAVTAALAAVGKRRQEYTNIKRPKLETTTATALDTVSITEPMSVADKKAFHRELMKHVVFATSAPSQQEETSEAEICYRGRCIKSEDLPANHKLN